MKMHIPGSIPRPMNPGGGLGAGARGLRGLVSKFPYDSLAVSSCHGFSYKWLHRLSINYCLDEEIEDVLGQRDKSVMVKR